MRRLSKYGRFTEGTDAPKRHFAQYYTITCVKISASRHRDYRAAPDFRAFLYHATIDFHAKSLLLAFLCYATFYRVRDGQSINTLSGRQLSGGTLLTTAAFAPLSITAAAYRHHYYRR